MHTANIEIENASSGRLQEVKNNGKSLSFQAQKVVAVAYMRWLLTRGSNCKALTGKILVSWIGSRLWEVFACERWSHMKVLPCITILFSRRCKLQTLTYNKAKDASFENTN